MQLPEGLRLGRGSPGVQGPDDARVWGAGVSGPSEDHLWSTCCSSRCWRGWNSWPWGTCGSGSSVFPRLLTGPVMGGRLLEWVGGCVSGEGSPDDHEQPQTEGCWAHGGAQQPLPRTRPCLPVCSFSPKCPLPSLLPLCHRSQGFMPQILPKCPEGTARRVGGSCLPPAPSHPGGSEGAPVTCQPGHC